jgi:hypothetical protein
LKDRVILGKTHPDFIYGLSSSLIYKDYDVFVSFQGVKGSKVANILRRTMERAGSSYNVSVDMLDAWTPEHSSNATAKIPFGLPVKQMDSRYVEDASYLRIRDFTVGKTFNLSRMPFSIRLFASAQNLFTFTKYKGYDPEVADGMDMGAYPKARTFTIGLGLTIN